MHAVAHPFGVLLNRCWRKDAASRSFAAKRMLTLLRSYGAALIGVTACTWVAFNLDLNMASSGFLYLALVILVAAYGGIWEATVTSISAFACLAYFFCPPLFSFRVSNPRDWMALGAFEFTAVFVSRLSHRTRGWAMEAVAKRRDSEHLYEISRQILLLNRSQDLVNLIPSLIREIFELRAVVLFDAIAASTSECGPCASGVEQQTRSAYYMNSDTFDSEMDSWFCAIRLGVRPIGGLALCGGKMTRLAATALASLCAVALERTRSFEKECRIEAARQSEELRTAVLDALAHEIKTPLTTIWTASSGLQSAGGLSDSQCELVNLIEKEVLNLNELTSRLLGAAKLDSTDFKPKREPLRFSDIADSVIQNINQRSRFHMLIPDHEPPVLADPKLMATALAQILDNAIKYSIPESTIDIQYAVSETEVTLTVRNQGMVIAPAERERIFERFYRAAETRDRAGGTGLGLSIVKRIVEAHCGQVWAEIVGSYGTEISIALLRAPYNP